MVTSSRLSSFYKTNTTKFMSEGSTVRLPLLWSHRHGVAGSNRLTRMEIRLIHNIDFLLDPIGPARLPLLPASGAGRPPPQGRRWVSAGRTRIAGAPLFTPEPGTAVATQVASLLAGLGVAELVRQPWIPERCGVVDLELPEIRVDSSTCTSTSTSTG